MWEHVAHRSWYGMVKTQTPMVVMLLTSYAHVACVYVSLQMYTEVGRADLTPGGLGGLGIGPGGLGVGGELGGNLLGPRHPGFGTIVSASTPVLTVCSCDLHLARPPCLLPCVLLASHAHSGHHPQCTV